MISTPALRSITGKPLQFLSLLGLSVLQVTALMSGDLLRLPGFGLKETPWRQAAHHSVPAVYHCVIHPRFPALQARRRAGFICFSGLSSRMACAGGPLIWRFISYYLFIIIGFFAVIIDHTYSARHRDKGPPEADEAAL